MYDFSEPIEDEIIANNTAGMSDEQKGKFLTEYYGKRRNPWVNFILTMSTGAFGIHKFYQGKKNQGFWYLGITLFGILFYLVFTIVILPQVLFSSLSNLESLESFEEIGRMGFGALSGMGALAGWMIVAALPFLILGIMILIDICTFKAAVKASNTELAKTINAKK